MDIATILHQLAAFLAGVLAGVVAFVGALHPIPLSVPIITGVATTTAPVATTTDNFPTSLSKKSVPAKSARITTTVVATSAASTTPQSSSAQTLDSTTLNSTARSSIVNIICTTLAGGSFKPISGSGVIVDGRGVILTNAHVAQFFLLRDYLRTDNIDCVIRTGSPAINTYRAELLYLPMQWIDDNASQITSTQATGTGENDFAFLRITGTYNPDNALPASIPHLALSTASPSIGDSMLLAAYPAGFLSGELIATQLYASSAFAYVTQLFTLDGANHIDVFSVGGSIESQAGSSGGAVVRKDGTLAGIISTAILQGSTNERDLRAISVGYIDRALSAQGQGGIAQLLTGDLAAKAADFNINTAPKETAELEAVLNAQ